MSEEQTATGDGEQSTEAAPTLNDVYAEFNVAAPQPTQTQTVQNNAPQPSPEPASATELPDPLQDPAGFAKAVAAENAALRQAIGDLHSNQQMSLAQAQKQTEQADLTTHVEAISKELGGAMDQDLIETHIGLLYRKDERFAQLWNNRGNNPALVAKAMAAVAANLKKSTTGRQDPQLAENQRALTEATKKGAVKSQRDSAHVEKDKAMLDLGDSAFENEWQRMVMRG